jgi:hypothetical protein
MDNKMRNGENKLLRGAKDMNILSEIKDGLKMGKDKAVSSILGIGAALKNKENRIITGMVLVGLGGALLLSCYVKVPQ